MNPSSPRFSSHKRKQAGAHYTPKELAEFVADQIFAASSSRAGIVIDPACGDGELLRAYRDRCPSMSFVGYDLDEEALELARANVGSGRFQRRDFLEVALDHREGGLFAPTEKADVVIANPPYVRTQVMGADRSQEIAAAFSLKGRVDLYHAFLEGIAEILRPGGIAGVIVSNRFMTTKAGAVVRDRILGNFEIVHVWDLGDTKIFDAAVLPAVLLLRRKNGETSASARMTTIYSIQAEATAEANSPIAALKLEGNVRVNRGVFQVQHGTLDFTEGPWRVANENVDSWLATVSDNTALSFRDIGKIRVGIKTTADKVFVRKEWGDPRPELLRPLLTHKSARRYRSLPPTHEILYPHTTRNGKKATVDLADYPLSRDYLENHRETLEKRTYVINAGRKWFEIWVPQRPQDWARPKLVWPDISERATFWISLAGELVQGDCYWLAADSPEKEELLWLAVAVANSKFIEDFYDRTCGNKLYAGRRRFMTQYVETFPLPDPALSISKKIIADAQIIYSLPPGDEADALVQRLDQEIYIAFGVGREEIAG